MSTQNGNTFSKRCRPWLIGGGLAILLIAVFAAGRATKTGDSPGAAGPDAVAEHDAEAEARAETIYYCPMHPRQTSTDPNATCPICGMDLVPGAPDDAEDDRGLPVLRMSERSIALMNIQVSPVERRAVEAPLHFLGRLEPDERRVIDVVARADSYIERLYANYLWYPLEKGEPLAEIYSPAVHAAARELLVVARQEGVRRGDGAALASATARLQRLGVSLDQIEHIVETGEIPRTYQVRSPIDGVMNEMGGHEGHWLAEGEHLAEVTDLSNLWVQLEAYERDLPWLKLGQNVRLTTEAYAGETFKGEVAFINPVVDARTRTARVRIDVPNPQGSLKPGMFVRGAVEMWIGERAPGLFEPSRVVEESPAAIPESEEAPLVIPASAPLITGRSAIVYVQDPDAERPTFEGRQIVLGSRAGDYYLVREGLDEGELVVTNGAFKIDSELQIRGRPSMMAPAVEEPEEPDAIDFREAPEPAGFAADVPASFGEELRPLFQGYFDMVAGLADDDFDAAREGLFALHEALQEIGQHRLDGDAHVAWMEHYERLHVLTHRLDAAEDLDGMRDHLQEITRELEEVAVSFGAGQLPTLYRLYCPMAHDDEGATWLQDHDTVDNAYFGSMMLRCGEVLGTLGDE